MAARTETLRSTSTTLFICSGVGLAMFMFNLLTGPTSALPLGILALLPYLVVAFIISGAIARTAAVVLEQQAEWRDAASAPDRTSPIAPRQTGTHAPAPRWTNEEA